MNTGHNPMLPLSEFVVEFIDHTKPKVQTLLWDDWFRLAGWPDYQLKGNLIVFRDTKKPEGIEIIMPENDPPYELIWTK